MTSSPEDFFVGVRVRLNALGSDQFPHMREWVGEICAKPRGELRAIKWGGKKSVDRFHIDLLEAVPVKGKRP